MVTQAQQIADLTKRLTAVEGDVMLLKRAGGLIGGNPFPGDPPSIIAKSLSRLYHGQDQTGASIGLTGAQTKSLPADSGTLPAGCSYGPDVNDANITSLLVTGSATLTNWNLGTARIVVTGNGVTLTLVNCDWAPATGTFYHGAVGTAGANTSSIVATNCRFTGGGTVTDCVMFNAFIGSTVTFNKCNFVQCNSNFLKTAGTYSLTDCILGKYGQRVSVGSHYEGIQSFRGAVGALTRVICDSRTWTPLYQPSQGGGAAVHSTAHIYNDCSTNTGVTATGTCTYDHCIMAGMEHQGDTSTGQIKASGGGAGNEMTVHFVNNVFEDVASAYYAEVATATWDGSGNLDLDGNFTVLNGGGVPSSTFIWSPTQKPADITLSNANLTAKRTATAQANNTVIRGDIAMSGKKFIIMNGTAVGTPYFGVSNLNPTQSTFFGTDATDGGWRIDGVSKFNNDSGADFVGWSIGSWIVIVDTVLKKAWSSRDGTTYIGKLGVGPNDATTGTGGADIAFLVNAGAVYFAFGGDQVNDQAILQTGVPAALTTMAAALVAAGYTQIIV